MDCETDPTPLPTPEVLTRAVALFSAMAHAPRLWVLVALSRHGPMSAGALQQIAGLEQTAMSHQLRVLREAHLVTTRRDGKWVIYELADDHVAHVVEDTLRHVVEPHGEDP